MADSSIVIRSIPEESPDMLPVVCICKVTVCSLAPTHVQGIQAQPVSLDWAADGSAIQASSSSLELQTCMSALALPDMAGVADTGASLAITEVRDIVWASSTARVGTVVHWNTFQHL